MNESPKQYFPSMRRVKQISVDHCGPAVVAMLLSHLGIKVWQRDVVRATGEDKEIKSYGMTVAELAHAVRVVATTVQFWYKDHAGIEDIRTLLENHQQPVGVEWQGIFGKYSDGDDGHYAVVTHIDEDKKSMLIADPYKPFAGVDRQIPIDKFYPRWWDENEVKDPQSGEKKKIKDVRLLFIVTKKDEKFPERLGMQLIPWV